MIISCRSTAQFGIINTIAGNGTAAYSGDGGAGTSASLNNPVGLSIDATGSNIYIADAGNNVIRKLNFATGTITTVVGTGTAGYTGDGGSALAATLNGPTGVFVDASNNIYIADFGNNAIRKVSGGIITTIGGTGVAGFSGDGGPATSAEMHSPFGIWVESSGNVLFTDQANVRVRKIDGSTGTITTIAGTGTVGYCCDGSPATAATFSHPSGICEDPSGIIYFCTQGGNARVRKIDLSGIIHTEMGNGTPGFSGDCGQATDAEIKVPQGVVSDVSGNIYLATTSDYRIRVVEAATGIIHTVAGDGATSYSGDGGSPLAAGMNPNAVTLDAANDIYVSGDNRVRKVTLTKNNDTVNFCQGDSVMLGSTTTYVDSFQWSTGDTTSSIMVHTSGVYWVKMYVCTYVSIDTYVVHSLAPVATIRPDTTICAGDSLVLTSLGTDVYPFTYLWSNGATTPAITVTSAGTYWLSVTEMGCTSANDTMNLALRPRPVISIGNDTSICMGDSVLLQSSPTYAGETYLWSTGSTASSIYASAAGNYWLHISDSGCNGVDTMQLTVNPYPPMPATSPIYPPPCSGNNLSFIVVDTLPGATYTWSGPDGFSSTQKNPVISNIPVSGTGVYTVNADLLGCVTTYTVYVTIDSTPAVPTVGSNSPVCSGNTISLTSDCVTPGVSYSWIGPGSYTSTDQNPTVINANTAETGNYSVTATKAGCHDTAFTFVQVNQTPTMTSAGSNSPVCEGGLLILSSNASPSSGTYYWSGPNSFTSTLEDPQILNVTMAASGIYSVYDVLNGCTSQTIYDTVTISPSPAPPTIISNAPVCMGGTLLLSATDDTAGVTFSWSGPGTFVAIGDSAMLDTIPLTASGLYIATAQLGACTTSSSANISITPPPPLTDSNSGPICAGDTLRLYATSETGVSYSWTGPYGFSSAAQNPVRVPTVVEDGGIYTVTATTSSATGSCVSVATDTVVINAAPAAPWVPWATYCQYYGAPQLEAVDASNVLWFTSAAAGGIGTPVAPIPSTDTPGIYWFYLNSTVNGCPSPIDSIQITVYPKPSASITAVEGFTCPHDSVQMTAVCSDPNITYTWSPDVYISSTTSASIVSLPITDEQYTVVATNHFGCTDTAFHSVHVYPAASIFLGVVDSVTLYVGQSYHIQPVTNCYTFAWFPPNGLSADSVSDPIATPTTNTLYTVEGFTELGCMVTDSIYFHVTDVPVYVLPNAFTPEETINSEFKLLQEGISGLNYFRIFDRWGKLVFETNDMNQGWNGMYHGTPQPQGVYVYELEAISTAGTTFTKKGNVTLMR